MATCHRLQRAFLLLAAIVSQGWIAECTDNDGVSCNTTDVRKATIGKEFTLRCSVRDCPDGPYRWFNDTGQRALLQETGADLTVSERVDSAAAVGGQNYACQCEEPEETRIVKCYTIWVTPYVQLNVPKKVAKLGSSVTISCSAESYPPANSVNFFELQHPLRRDINHSRLTLVDTGVEYHIANASGSDGGEYECIVIVYETPDGWHSQNQSRTNLTVYEPPVIIETAVMLSSAGGEKSTVVECVVESAEPMLEVWVNWTTGNGSFVGDDYTMRRDGGGVYILARHRVTKDDAYSYTCQLFSAYSPEIPEDNKTVETKFQQRTNTSGVKGSKSEECQQWKIATIALTVAIVLVAVIICSLIIIWLLCKKISGKRTIAQSNGEQNVVRYNRTEEVVNMQGEVNQDGDTENMAEIPENGTVDILSNQSNDSSTTTSGESGQHSGATPRPDLESQENESSETDSIGEEYSSSSRKKWPQNGRRRSSSTSSYRRGSDPEGKNLIKKPREGRPTQS